MDDTVFATVILEVDGVSGADRYWAPRFIGFQLVDSRTEQNSSMRVDPDKGRTLVTQEIHRYQLKAKRPGNFTIDPARVRIKGSDYETKGAYVTVTAGRVEPGSEPAVASPQAPDPTAAGGVGAPGFVPPDPSTAEPLFLYPVVDKTTAYVGEQVTVTWLLYTRKEILKFEPKQPALDGMWSEVLFEPSGFFKYHETMLGRRPYSVVVVAKRAIFPTKVGRLRIPPLQADIVTLGAALGRSERVRSPSVYVSVRALPKGAPASFDPTYVGRFEAAAESDRSELSAGDSLVLKLDIRGRGAIRRLTTPALKLEGFEVRAPSDFDESLDPSTSVIAGSRTYRYWLTPQKGGPQAVPSIEIAYFDPEAREYGVARTKPIPVLVRGDPNEKGKDPSSERDNVIAKDIRLLHEAGAVSDRILPTAYRHWWFLAVVLFPPLGFVFVVLGDRILRQLRRETPRARLRRARGNAKRRFRLAEIHLRGNRPGKFFGELARVIFEHLEERLERPLQSLTRDDLAQVLKSAGFARTTVERIVRELDECDFARFSPTGASREEMQRALVRVRELLAQIEKTRLDVATSEEAA